MIPKQLIALEDKVSDVYKIKILLQSFAKEKFGIDLDTKSIDISIQENDFGDLNTNFCLKFAKEFKSSPKFVAESFLEYYSYIGRNEENERNEKSGKDRLNQEKEKNVNKNNTESKEDEKIKDKLDFISKVDIAGPGFINFHLSNKKLVEKTLKINSTYGTWSLGEERQAMVEFGQPNTHKAITVGHVKSGISGLATSNLLENLGYKVIRANYFGDVGLHVGRTVWGFINRTEKGETKGFDTWDLETKMNFIAETYVYANGVYKEDEEKAEEIKAVNKKVYTKEDQEINRIYLKLREVSIEHQTDVFSQLGILYDRLYPESEVLDIAYDLIEKNKNKVFKLDKGAWILDGKDHRLNTWVFLTSQGLPTYSGKDMGLGYLKFEEYPNLEFCLIHTSVEQKSYFDGVIKALELCYPKSKDRYYFEGFGWLLQNNKKTSSRSGNNIGVYSIFGDAYEYSLAKISNDKKYSKEQTEKIARKVMLGGLKFLFLSREFHIDINYDPKQFLDPEGFSGPYVMYAYVRAKNILKIADENEGWEKTVDINPEDAAAKLTETERKILKLLFNFPYITLEAGQKISPHLLVHYLFQLSQEFNKFYKESRVVDNGMVNDFRYKLVEAISIVLKKGLNLVGIDELEEM